MSLRIVWRKSATRPKRLRPFSPPPPSPWGPSPQARAPVQIFAPPTQTIRHPQQIRASNKWTAIGRHAGQEVPGVSRDFPGRVLRRRRMVSLGRCLLCNPLSRFDVSEPSGDRPLPYSVSMCWPFYVSLNSVKRR